MACFVVGTGGAEPDKKQSDLTPRSHFSLNQNIFLQWGRGVDNLFSDDLPFSRFPKLPARRETERELLGLVKLSSVNDIQKELTPSLCLQIIHEPVDGFQMQTLFPVLQRGTEVQRI